MVSRRVRIAGDDEKNKKNEVTKAKSIVIELSIVRDIRKLRSVP